MEIRFKKKKKVVLKKGQFNPSNHLLFLLADSCLFVWFLCLSFLVQFNLETALMHVKICLSVDRKIYPKK